MSLLVTEVRSVYSRSEGDCRVSVKSKCVSECSAPSAESHCTQLCDCCTCFHSIALCSMCNSADASWPVAYGTSSKLLMPSMGSC